jgi:hypothetical protein
MYIVFHLQMTTKYFKVLCVDTRSSGFTIAHVLPTRPEKVTKLLVGSDNSQIVSKLEPGRYLKALNVFPDKGTFKTNRKTQVNCYKKILVTFIH